MAKIEIGVFEGRTPRTYTKLTDERKAQTAINCDLRHGNLRPMYGVTSVQAIGGLRIVENMGQITAFANYGDTVAGTVKVTSEAHGLATNDEIEIWETTNYNGWYAITKIDADSFYITATWVSNDGTGEWIDNWIVIQSDTGNLTSTALVKNGDGTVTLETDSAHGLVADDLVWFDSTVGGIGYYPSVYTITAVTSTTFTIQLPSSAWEVDIADPSDSDWFTGDYVITGTVVDFYLLDDSWLAFGVETDVAESFIEDNNFRIYYTTGAGVRQTDYDLAIQGQAYTWPNEWYQLGIQQPATAPIISSTSPATDGTFYGTETAITVDQSTAYVYTYVTGLLEESIPSDASTLIDISAGQYVQLTAAGFADPVGAKNNVDAVRIYKLVSGTAGAEYQQINKTGIIMSIADDSGDAKFRSDGHGLIGTEELTMTGTLAHNGNFIVEYIDADYFYLQDTDGNRILYSANSSGRWNVTSDLTLADVQANGFIDRTNPDDAGTILYTADFDPPPSDLHSLILYTNNTYAGLSSNLLCLCEPNYPYAWPVENQIPVTDTAIGLGHHMESIIVCTSRRPYITVGTDPQSMILTPLPYQRPCIAKGGIVSSPMGVFYPTHDGLFHVTSSNGTLITDGLITREQWKEYDLDNIKAVYYDERYYCFFKGSNTGFYIDLNEPLRIIDLQLPGSIVFDNIFTDGEDLYILGTDDYIYKWDDDSDNPLTYTWKSKKFQIGTLVNFSCGRVISDLTGDVTVNVYVDGTLKYTSTVSSDNPFRLPSGYRGRVVEIELTGTSHVDLVAVATSVNNLIYG